MEDHGKSHSTANDRAPGEHRGTESSIRQYLFGLALAFILTLASFWAAQTDMVYGPAIPILLAALAIGQMGVHLVFFLHISTGPDDTNNTLALAFGVFVVCLVVFGSLLIMYNLNINMMPSKGMMEMQP